MSTTAVGKKISRAGCYKAMEAPGGGGGGYSESFSRLIVLP